MWYHGTNEINNKSINEKGFSIPDDYGIWGSGVYFTKDKSEASQYGNSMVEIEVKASDIVELDYKKDVSKLFSSLSVEDEEGTPQMKDYILKMGKSGVVIRYSEDDVNLIVYDTSIIKLLV